MLKLLVKSELIAGDVKAKVEEFKKNVEGASLIEYSLLIGLISAAVVIIIGAVGGKVTGWWTALNSAAPAATT